MSAIPAPAPEARKTADEHDILFQRWFKSVGPRTYAAQVKKASNGNHYVVMTEGRRDSKTDEIRKNRLFIYSEDFVEFFKLLHDTALFLREHPVPDDVKIRQQKMWSKDRKPGGRSNAGRRGSSQRRGAEPGLVGAQAR